MDQHQQSDYHFRRHLQPFTNVEKISTQKPRLPPKQGKGHIRALGDPDTSGGTVLFVFFPHRRKNRGIRPTTALACEEAHQVTCFQQRLADNFRRLEVRDLWRLGRVHPACYEAMGWYVYQQTCIFDRKNRPITGTIGRKVQILRRNDSEAAQLGRKD
jgi:hypothetical protein